MFSKANPKPAPLKDPEIICERFKKIALDVVGPLDRSKSGFQYILTGMDLATSYCFAFPMRTFTAKETADNFLKIIRDLEYLRTKGCSDI